MPRLRIIGALVALLLALSACAGASGALRAYDYRINTLPASASDLTTVIGYHDDVDPDRGEVTTSRFLEEWQEIARPALVPYADLPAPIQALPIAQRAILDLQERTSNGELINVLPGRYLTYDGDTAATPTEHLDSFLYLEEQPDGTIEAALVRTWMTGVRSHGVSAPASPRDSWDGEILVKDTSEDWYNGFVSRLDGAIVDFIAPNLRPYREAYDERIRDSYSLRRWSARAITASCRPDEVSTGCLYMSAEHGPIAGPYVATSQAVLVDRLMFYPGASQEGQTNYMRDSLYALEGELPGTAVQFISYYAPPPRPGIVALPADDQIAILLHEDGDALDGQALAGLPTYWPPAK